MKRFFALLLLLFIPVVLFSQTHFDIPYRAVYDTVTHQTTRAVLDFFFNPANDSTVREVINSGSVDLNVIADMWSVAAGAGGGTDTLTIEVYGLTTKKFPIATYGTDVQITFPTDSTRLGTIPVSSTTSITSFSLDDKFSTFFMFDGVRVVLKTGGSDLDSVKTWSNCRMYNPNP